MRLDCFLLGQQAGTAQLTMCSAGAATEQCSRAAPAAPFCATDSARPTWQLQLLHHGVLAVCDVQLHTAAVVHCCKNAFLPDAVCRDQAPKTREGG